MSCYIRVITDSSTYEQQDGTGQFMPETECGSLISSSEGVTEMTTTVPVMASVYARYAEDGKHFRRWRYSDWTAEG